jgi:hypothetical protein
MSGRLAIRSSRLRFPCAMIDEAIALVAAVLVAAVLAAAMRPPYVPTTVAHREFG